MDREPCYNGRFSIPPSIYKDLVKMKKTGKYKSMNDFVLKALEEKIEKEKNKK